MSRRIFILKGNEQYGPFDQSAVEAYIAQGTFSLTDMCWQEGWDDWFQLSLIVSRKPPIRTQTSRPSQNSFPQRFQHENVIYSDNLIEITTARILIDGTTYALRNVTSVKMTIKSPENGYRIGLTIFSLILGMPGFVVAKLGAEKGSWGVAFTGVILFLIGLSFYRKTRRMPKEAEYNVVITSGSGESNALTSVNRSYIKNIVSHINEAIASFN
jgi:hypothetical protein